MRKSLKLIFPLILGNLVLFSHSVSAQEAELNDAGGVSLIELFQQGGWAMYPLLFLSIAGACLVIYNFLSLREKTFITPVLGDQLKPMLEGYQIDEAKELCANNSSVLINIVEAGLDRIEPGVPIDPTAVEKAMEESSLDELTGPFAFVGYLSIVATVSPMVGMLGTVSGMVQAFRTIATQGMGRPELLADNISEALITTATGLTIGIPAMIFYFYFKGRYTKLTSRVARAVGDQYHSLMKGVHAASQG
jgi:biopolymer transport protein ExbB